MESTRLLCIERNSLNYKPPDEHGNSTSSNPISSPYYPLLSLPSLFSTSLVVSPCFFFVCARLFSLFLFLFFSFLYHSLPSGFDATSGAYRAARLAFPQTHVHLSTLGITQFLIDTSAHSKDVCSCSEHLLHCRLGSFEFAADLLK